jgi:hypothetical protein
MLVRSATSQRQDTMHCNILKEMHRSFPETLSVVGRLHNIHHRGAVMVTIKLRLPTVEANLDVAELISMDISPLRYAHQQCLII